MIISGSEETIELFLGNNSQTLLNKDSRYYLVNDEFWKCIEDIIFQKIESDSNHEIKQLKQLYETYLKDLVILEHYQKKNMLVVEVS